MERQRNLFMEGKTTQCSEEYNNHPIFIVNQTAAQPNAKRRSKLKTNRQKNAERLLRQGAKWEKERQKLNEIEKQKELDEKARQVAAMNMVNDYNSGCKDRGMKQPRFVLEDMMKSIGFKHICPEIFSDCVIPSLIPISF